MRYQHIMAELDLLQIGFLNWSIMIPMNLLNKFHILKRRIMSKKSFVHTGYMAIFTNFNLMYDYGKKLKCYNLVV